MDGYRNKLSAGPFSLDAASPPLTLQCTSASSVPEFVWYQWRPRLDTGCFFLSLDGDRFLVGKLRHERSYVMTPTSLP